MKSHRWLAFSALFYSLSWILLQTTSLNRVSIISDSLETIPHELVVTTKIAFLFLLLAYSFLLLGRKTCGNTWRRFLMIIALAFFFILPLTSRDAVGYIASAYNSVHLHQNPYTTIVGQATNPFGNDLRSAWWIAFPSPYGPVLQFILMPTVIFVKNNLLASLIIYKLIVASACLLGAWLLSRYQTSSAQQEDHLLLIALNPAVLLHVFIEGHNDIFLICFLLASLIFLQRGAWKKALFFFILAVFSKYYALLFLPLFWMQNNRFSTKRFLASCSLSAMLFFLFLQAAHLNLTTFFALPFGMPGSCLYSCSPALVLTYYLFSHHWLIIDRIIFLGLYAFITWKHLLQHLAPEPFIYLSFLAFSFLAITWLAPWYLVLPIIISLLSISSRSLRLTWLLTAFSLANFFLPFS